MISLPQKTDHRKTIAEWVGKPSDGLAPTGHANHDLSLKRRQLHRPRLPWESAGICAYHVPMTEEYHWRELPQVLFLSRQNTAFLSRKNYVCRYKIFLLRQNYFVAAKVLSRQAYFLSRQTRVCRDKTRLLSRQKYACRDKYLSGFVRTKMILVAAPPMIEEWLDRHGAEFHRPLKEARDRLKLSQQKQKGGQGQHRSRSGTSTSGPLLGRGKGPWISYWNSRNKPWKKGPPKCRHVCGTRPLPTTSEVSDFLNCMILLKQYLRAKDASFKAGKIKTRFPNWAKLHFANC